MPSLALRPFLRVLRFPRFLRFWLVVALLVHRAAPALAAAGVARDDACPSGNLLVGSTPSTSGASASTSLLVDGAIVPESSVWPAPDVLVTLRGPITYDLGQPRAIREIYAQVDADQAFDVELSTDDATWLRAPVAAHATASGVISRTVNLPSVLARWVRIVPRGVSGSLALTELQVRCRGNASDPGTLHVVGAQASVSPGPVASPSLAVNPSQLDSIKLSVVVLALLWLAVSLVRPVTEARVGRAVLDVVIVLLGLVAVLGYFNLGAYRYPKFAHQHDVFHYFVGAKYFPELGYDELYTCAAVAEAEAGFRDRVELRSQRDLHTNALVGGDEVLRHAGECRQRFTDARWRDFAADVRYFASSLSLHEWNLVVGDHGFNASPTWIAVGRAVAGRAPASEHTIGNGDSMRQGIVLALDPALLALSLGAIAWAFGARTASLAAIVFGTSPLSDFSWVGGGFLRELWLTFLVVGICLVRRKRPALGGAALAVSTLLQLLPAFTLVSVALAAGLELLRERRVPTEARRILVGATLTVVVLLPVSLLGAGRSDAFGAFVANTAKHAATPAVNLVGLPAALSYRTATRVEVLYDANAVDPFARVRAARVENLAEARPVQWLAVALGLWLLVRAAKNRPPWWSMAALGLGLVPLVIDTSCYYAAWLAALALAGDERRATFGVVLATVVGALWAKSAFGQEESYVASSWVLVAGALGALCVAAWKRRSAATVTS